MPHATADLTHERGLVAAGGAVIGVDEVGRGALAGPVFVGAVLIRPHDAHTVPTRLTDSKLLTAQVRDALVPLIHAWAVAHAVGSASAVEVDAVGVVGALRRAAERALAGLRADVGGGVVADAVVLLDGSHDWLTRPAMLELPMDGVRPDPFAGHDHEVPAAPTVVTRVKADVSCASVAAASVLAKVARDAHMVDLATHHPHYGWDGNKGYASIGHAAALAEHGPTPQHRLSWRLPGLSESI